MSGLADAYADAHLNLDTLDIDIDQARAKLQVAVAQWEQILNISAEIELDTARASAQLEGVVRQWEVGLSRNLVATVDLDTDGANDDLAASVIAWRAAVDSPLVATVDLDTDGATADLAGAVVEWRAMVQGISGTVHIDVDQESATTARAAADAVRDVLNSESTGSSSTNIHAVLADLYSVSALSEMIGGRFGKMGAEAQQFADKTQGSLASVRALTQSLNEAADSVERISAGLNIGDQRIGVNVDLDASAADAELLAAVDRWQATLARNLVAAIDLDTEGATADLLLAMSQWQALIERGIVASVDMDTTDADARLAVAVDEWQVVMGDGPSTGVNMDTFSATEQLVSAIEEWAALTSDSIDVTVDMDTDTPTAKLIAAAAEWREIVSNDLAAGVDVSASAATAHLEAAVLEWRAMTADDIEANVDMDTTSATAQLEAWIEDAKAMLAGALEAHVDMDTADATANITTAAEGWERSALVSGDVEFDLLGASAQLEAAVAEWKAMSSFTATVRMNVEDIESLENLRTTFAGIKPDLDLPVRFHLDAGSVGAATEEIQALGELWESMVTLSTRINPEGQNELPNRPIGPGNPAQPRGPNIGDEDGSPLIRPQVDPGPAIAQSKELQRIIDGLLKIVVPIDLNEPGALADAEALAPLIQNLLKVTSEVDLSGEAGALASARALAPLLEEALALTASVDVNDAAAVAKVEAIRTLLNGVLRDLVLKMTVDGDEVGPDIIALRATIETALGRIPAKVEVEGARQAAIDAEAIKKLVKGVLDITVPVKLDTDRAVEHAADIRPLIKNLLDITASVDFDVDGDKAAAQAKAITDLIEKVTKITVPLGVNDKVAIEQTAKLRSFLEGMLRDIVLKIEVNGGGATAETLLLVETLKKSIGDLRIDADLRTTGAEAHAVAFKALLKKIAGRLEVDVDLDTKGAVAHAGLLAATGGALSQVFSGIPRIFGSVASSMGLAADTGETVSGAFKGVLSSGEGVSGLFSTLSGLADEMGTAMSGASGIGGQLSAAMGVLGGSGGLGGLIGPLTTAISMFAKISLMMAAVAAGLPLIVGGISALASAAGGIVALAGGFVTLAGGIGLAGAAAGALGIALNADLLQRVKDGLGTLKDAVAAATRDVGEGLLNKFQAPFINVLANLAESAAGLASRVIDPLANSALKFLGTFDAILQSDAAGRFADRLVSTVSSVIDLFSEYLPAYLDLFDKLGESSGAVFDTVKALLDVGLQSGGLWEAIGSLMSHIAKLMSDIAPIALPLAEALVNTINAIASSAPVMQMIQGGVEAWQAILVIINDIGAGIESTGIEGAMVTVAAAFDQIANSGLGETLGSLFATIINEGANVIDMLADFLSSDFFQGLIDWVSALLPLIEDIGQGFLDGFDLGGMNTVPFMAFLKSTLAILSVIADLAPGIGLVIGAMTSVVSFSLAGIMTALFAVGGAIAEVLTGIVGFVVEIIEKIGWVVEAVTGYSGIKDWAADASDSIWEFEQNGREAIVGFIGGLWDMGTAATETGEALDLGVGQSAERAAQHALEFRDELGQGADALADYAAANGLTAIEIDTAANAAIAAADQFKYTTGLIGDLREEASKPIALAFDFDKTKLDLDGLITYVDDQVKTVRENAAAAINTDPTTEALASQVVGADGTTLNEATSKPKEEFVPAHLETSVADAVQEMYDNAVRDIDNESFLRTLRFNGFTALADQLETFDGPKLELAIQELGDATSQAVRDANGKIEDAQKELDVNFNPIQEAIGNAQKDAVLKMRRIEIVKELESKGFDGLASQFAELKPEDLEAAIRTYEAIGGVDGPLVAEMEKQLDDLAAALETKATEIDPIGKMWAAAAATPGAQAGLVGKILTPEQIAAAVDGNNSGTLGPTNGKEGSFSPQQAEFDKAVDTVQSLLANRNGPWADPEVVNHWEDLIRGFDDATGEAVTPSDMEARILAALQLRDAQGKGQTVNPDGTISAGQAEATTAGSAVATAFAQGMTNSDGSKLVESAANDMIKLATDTIITKGSLPARAAATLSGMQVGEALTDGITVGMLLNLPNLILAATNVATIVASVMKATLDINSPSEVTKSIGAQIVDGLALGLEAGHDRVTVAAAGLADSVTGALGGVTDPSRAFDGIYEAMPGRGPGPGFIGGRPYTVDPVVRRAGDDPNMMYALGGPESPDLFAIARAAASAATAAQATSAPTPQQTPQEASAAARGGQGAYIHADQLIINGVPGAEQLPERVDEEFWRIGYGESPRRRIDP